MKKIDLRIHGVIDYIIGSLLIISPVIFNFDHTAQTWTLVAAGTGSLAYCLLTDYQFGVFKIISTSTHLLLDMAVGMLLAVSPWFGFAENTWVFHLITGGLIVFISMFTNPKPVYRLIRYRRRKLHKPLYRTYSIR
jgi:hypothetical protein